MQKVAILRRTLQISDEENCKKINFAPKFSTYCFCPFLILNKVFEQKNAKN